LNEPPKPVFVQAGFRARNRRIAAGWQKLSLEIGAGAAYRLAAP
jgi:hypothetical protein